MGGMGGWCGESGTAHPLALRALVGLSRFLFLPERVKLLLDVRDLCYPVQSLEISVLVLYLLSGFFCCCCFNKTIDVLEICNFFPSTH